MICLHRETRSTIRKAEIVITFFQPKKNAKGHSRLLRVENAFTRRRSITQIAQQQNFHTGVFRERYVCIPYT